MNILLVFFAIPLATVILSGILATFNICPLKVSGIFFSIFIVTAAALGGTVELFFAAIIYTIISFITASIVCFIINRRYQHFWCNDVNTNNSANVLQDVYSENCDNNQSSSILNSTDDSSNLLTQNMTRKDDYYNKRYR